MLHSYKETIFLEGSVQRYGILSQGSVAQRANKTNHLKHGVNGPDTLSSLLTRASRLLYYTNILLKI